MCHKKKLFTTLITIAHNWEFLFDNYAVRAVISKLKEKIFQGIHDARKFSDENHATILTTEKELQEVVNTLEKFLFNLIGSKVVVITSYAKF